MPLPDKRSTLQALTKARLRELVDAFELKLAAAETKDAHVDILARARRVPLESDHGLDDGGREKAVRSPAYSVNPPLSTPTAARSSGRPPPPVPRDAPVWRDTGFLEPGQFMHVRSRQYLVNELEQRTVVVAQEVVELVDHGVVGEGAHAVLLGLQARAVDAQVVELEVLTLDDLGLERHDVVPPPQPGHATLIRLYCLEDDAQGDALAVPREHKLDSSILGRASLDRVTSRGFESKRGRDQTSRAKRKRV